MICLIISCLSFAMCSPCFCFAFLYLYGLKSLFLQLINKIGHLLNFTPFTIPDNPSAPFNSECPVCHGDTTLPVQTNCNHKYCSGCIIDWWQTKGATKPVSCPCCRREIVFLLVCYEQEGLGREERRVLSQIQDYNRKFSNTNLLGNWTRFYTQDSIAIVTYIWNSFSLLPHDVKMAVLAYTVLLIVYLISPIDILPEAILGPFGLLDDGVAIGIYIRQVLVRFMGHLASQGEGLVH